MKQKKDIIIVGFALFSVFFGASNLIFPPFIGVTSGSEWLTSFLGFVLGDVGIILLSIYAIAKCGDYQSIVGRAGKNFGLSLEIMMMLCLGPILAIPRTAATTFELSITPLIPGVNSVFFSIIFFALTLILTIRPTKVMDIIGKFLTPVLLICLAFLIGKGMISPLGTLNNEINSNELFVTGLTQGYQTMDALGAVALAALVMNSIISKGYTNRAEKRKILIKSNAVAAIFLILVYGGLCYIGATASTSLDPEIGQTLLLTTLTHLIMGYWGKVLLAIIVFFACLTTAVGLTSVAAEYYEEVSKGRLSYKVLVVAICAISTVISTVGVSDIIKVAGPLLDIIYPVAVTLIVLTLMSNKIKSNAVFNISAIVACLFGVMNVLKVGFIQSLPLSEVGLSWVIPVLIVSVISIVVTSSKSNKGEKLKDTQIS